MKQETTIQGSNGQPRANAFGDEWRSTMTLEPVAPPPLPLEGESEGNIEGERMLNYPEGDRMNSII